MKERPILFNAEMVRAVLDGRKTVTRRVVKPQPPSSVIRCNRYCELDGPEFLWMEQGRVGFEMAKGLCCPVGQTFKSPYGSPGDRLWVRETWQAADCAQHIFECPPREIPSGNANVWYRADGELYVDDGDGCIAEDKHGNERTVTWRPSIHMPHWASRIQLEVVSVRVERVQEISRKDAISEGLTKWLSPNNVIHYGIQHADVWELDPRLTFKRLWDSINAKRGYGWDANPWCWVVEFKRIEP